MKKLKLIMGLLLSVSIASNFNFTIQAQAEEETIEYEYINIFESIPYNIIEMGSSVKITLPENANEDKIEYVYSSEDTSIASVDQSGTIKAIAPGETRITVAPKNKPDMDSWVGVTVAERIIRISGLTKCEAGKTYQLKSSEKDVVWDCSNMRGVNAKASIDSKTGKLKVRNAGLIYVKCTSKDGKSLGAIYINATGPTIERQDITLDKIVIKKDEHLINYTEMIAAGKLPKTVKAPYTYKNKKEEVELSIVWYGSYFDSNIYDKKGSYTISGYLKAPEGYFLEDEGIVKVDVEFIKKQTDNRKKIVSIKPDTITLSKNKHITYFWDAIIDTKLKCKLEDGSTVELPIGWVSCKEEYISQVGTYEFKVGPRDTPGYDTGGYPNPSAIINIKVTKEQTYLNESTLEDIADESWVYEHTSQDPIK